MRVGMSSRDMIPDQLGDTRARMRSPTDAELAVNSLWQYIPPSPTRDLNYTIESQGDNMTAATEVGEYIWSYFAFAVMMICPYTSGFLH